VLDPLIDGQDRHVAGSRQAPVAQERRETGQHPGGTIRHGVDTLDIIGARQMQAVLGNRLALMLQERGSVVSEDLFNI
jgi:hypothetical protein